MAAPVSGGTGPVAQRDWGQWAVEHTRALIYAAAGVVVIIAAVWMYMTSERRKEAYASQALAAARADAQAGNLPLAANDLTRLIDRYGGSRAADEAVVMLNQVRLIEGGTQVGLVVTDLQAFVRKHHPDYVLTSAWSLLGGALEQQGKFRDAAAAYGHAAELAPHDFEKVQNLLDRGRTLTVAGDSAGARAAYAEVVQKYGTLPQAQEARVRLGELGVAAPIPAAPAAAASGSG
jgi:tetratricopeptide (TPR) repeat protein